MQQRHAVGDACTSRRTHVHVGSVSGSAPTSPRAERAGRRSDMSGERALCSGAKEITTDSLHVIFECFATRFRMHGTWFYRIGMSMLNIWHWIWNRVTEQSFGTGSTSDEDSAMHRRCSERARALGAMKRQLVSPEVTRKSPGSYQESSRVTPSSALPC